MNQVPPLRDALNLLLQRYVPDADRPEAMKAIRDLLWAYEHEIPSFVALTDAEKELISQLPY